MQVAHPPGRAEPLGLAVKNNSRSFLPFLLHFHIEPGYAFGPPCAQCLENRLLGGEARRKMGHGIPVPFAVSLLLGREEPEEELLLQSFHDTAKSLYLNDINAYADDHPGLRKGTRTFRPVSAAGRLTMRMKTSQYSCYA